MENPKQCPLSHGTMSPVFSALVLKKYHVQYYYCHECGLLQTEDPYWLSEAYEAPISELDTGIVARNIYHQKRFEPLLYKFFDSSAKFLDIGGGYGLFARLMRDIGFDFYSIDKFTSNIFAAHFEPGDDFHADSLFAFEVFEHIEHPLEFLAESFDRYSCKTIFFSTLVFSDTVPQKDWWYYVFESGQHVSFYQPHTLDLLAKELSCRYFQIDSTLHLITDLELSYLDRLLINNRLVYKVYRKYTRVKRKNISKTWDDHQFLKNQISQDIASK
jgi:hypothetical protein